MQYAADNARFLGEAVLELSALVTHTRAVLDALPADRPWPELERLRDLHRDHHDDWGADSVQGALEDCLSGLDEMAHLVLSLQDSSVARAPHPRKPSGESVEKAAAGGATWTARRRRHP